MLFGLEVLQAYHGDCLILHYGSENHPHFAVIDGGPGHIYDRVLRPRLAQLRAGWSANQPLPIDLLMVSHVDDDHINGVLDLLSELTGADDDGVEAPWRVRTLWHNSFDDILGNPEEEIFSTLRVSIASAGAPVGRRVTGLSLNDLPVLAAGIAQGRQLRDKARRLNLTPLNRPFQGLVMTRAGREDVVMLDDHVKLTVVHPNEARIEALHAEWEKALKEARDKGDPRVLMAACRDTSAANLSSIVVMAECHRKRMLLTGDARGDDILVGLEAAGLLHHGKCSVDILKLPHHGSDRNVSTDFFRKVKARHYVVSGDGAHDNPEIATLRMISDARSDDRFTLHLTNKTGKKRLGPKLTQFFAQERTDGRRYAVNYRADDALSIKINLLGDISY